MAGNKQVSALIHAAAASDDVRLGVPVLCLLEAERERPGTVVHVGVLPDVVQIVEDDYAMAVTVAGLCRDGVAFGVAAAVHVARPNPALPEGALVIGGNCRSRGLRRARMGVMDLNR
jgi:hypothetical protein